MNRTVCDTHIHTKHSCDSRAALEAYCAQAIKRGIGALCFTDHVDHNPNDDGKGFYSPEAFFSDFLPLQEKYRAELTLLCGVEFAEPHLYRDALSALSELPYDYILGSVHFWYRDMFVSSMVKAGVPAEVCYAHYWDEVLAAVRAGGFDALAHMDFPKRYYGRLIADTGKLHEICSEMVRNQICLEINTSSLRKNMAEPMPGREILSIYKACGGKYVTVGSDAHRPGDLAAGNAQARELIDFFSFEEVIFTQRRPHAFAS
ncbi:MAG: histidinol-phosphatase HisJ family protein [Oscillospiraceae bacterium]|jgi:histidinol-phosphatase (PHP family)|nr:histidinol-phosphatase HisJ family protein [Oscillospiraceae bacterium]